MQTLIFVVIGSLGLVFIGVLLAIFIWRKCKEKIAKIRSSAPLSEAEAVSIHSATSKDHLLYGSTKLKLKPAQPQPTAPRSKVRPSGSQPAAESTSEEELKSRGDSCSSSTKEGFMEAKAKDELEPVDSTTRFLQRRISQETFEMSNKAVGAIRPDLYVRKRSVVTAPSSGSKIFGQVRLRLQYDFSKSDFILAILETKNFPASLNEFFFKIVLDPEIDTKCIQTGVKKKQEKNTELKEKEEFKFPVTFEELMERRLLLKLFDTGRIGRIPTVCGEILLVLAELDPSAELEVWADVEPKTQAEIYGEVQFSMNYLQSVQRLTLTLHKARDLKKMDLSGSSDPYVKVLITHDGKAIKKRRSSVRKHTLAPVWNEALNFSLPEKALKKCQIELIVMDHDLIGNDEPIGQILIGSESVDPRAKHLWEDLVQTKSAPPTWLTLHYCAPGRRRNSE